MSTHNMFLWRNRKIFSRYPLLSRFLLDALCILQTVCLARRPTRHNLSSEASAGSKDAAPGNEAPKPQKPVREYIPPSPPPP